MIRHLYVAYFSPTGRTREVALCLAKGMAETVDEIDLSQVGEATRVFEESDVVLFAAPVFAGRIPVQVLDRIQRFQANQAQAVAAVVYGNRHYDDSLLELSNSLQALGFRLLAGATLVAEHSMLREVAAGRPDVHDKTQLKEFGEKIVAKSASDVDYVAINVPGNQPYVERKQLPIIPVVSGDCNVCGICAIKCPVQAIDREKPQAVQMDKCILCTRCIMICPKKARSLPAQAMQMLEQKLAPAKKVRRDNELYI